MTTIRRSNFIPMTILERDENEPSHLPPAFHIMIKPRGPICNLDCTCCFYLRKEQLYEKGTSFYMPEDVLEEFTRQYIEAQQVDEVHFGWQGGEPTLMGLDFFRKAVELQRKYRKPKSGSLWTFCIRENSRNEKSDRMTLALTAAGESLKNVA